MILPFIIASYFTYRLKQQTEITCSKLTLEKSVSQEWRHISLICEKHLKVYYTAVSAGNMMTRFGSKISHKTENYSYLNQNIQSLSSSFRATTVRNIEQKFWFKHSVSSLIVLILQWKVLQIILDGVKNWKITKEQKDYWNLLDFVLNSSYLDIISYFNAGFNESHSCWQSRIEYLGLFGDIKLFAIFYWMVMVVEGLNSIWITL